MATSDHSGLSQVASELKEKYPGACGRSKLQPGLEPAADDTGEEALSEEMIDETPAESFPASDPPSWILGGEKRAASSHAEETPKTGEDRFYT
jgi:hypothetical protein